MWTVARWRRRFPGASRSPAFAADASRLVVGVDFRRLCGCPVGFLALDGRALGELLRLLLALLRAAVPLRRLLPELLRLLALLALLACLAAAEHDHREHDDGCDCNHDPDPGCHQTLLRCLRWA